MSDSVRLLIIDDDPRFRALLRHHVSCRWPHVACVDHDPALRGPLAPEVRASGFDAVLLAGPRPLEWLQALAGRNGFAPVVYLGGQRGDEAARRAAEHGATAVLGRDKVEHDRLIAAIEAAGERQARAREAAGPDAYRFGDACLAGYRSVRRLASGPLARLFLAECEADASLVAIKIARRDGTGPTGSTDRTAGDHAFRRFLREYEIARRIAGRRVVRMLDLGVSEQHAYLVMEYFPAGSLRERMRQPISPAQALGFALGIARGLADAHAAGVLHRDLKPGNLMLREDGSPALIDFGLAHSGAPDDADPTLISGTPHYMSPEQGHGEPIDARSDLYSLGVILYEMLAARKPYAADNPMAIIYMHRKMPLPQLPRLLGGLQPLLDRLLAKSPADRFESAAAAARALQQALEESAAAGLPAGAAGVPSGASGGSERAA